MAQQLPLFPSEANYRFTTVLEGTAYVINIRWNERESKWYMDLLTEEETPIRTGMALLLGTLVGGRSVSESFPAGDFVVTDLANTGVDAGLDDLGIRVQVWYVSQAEVDALTGDELATGFGGVVLPEFS